MDKGSDREKPGVTLARNPLGIISLFVFFIEAIATISLRIAVDTDYIGHIVWFIILFPTLIVLLFFITLWLKRESLYSPMEFREDRSFLELFGKIDRIEARQEAAIVDPVTADLEDVFETADKLLKLKDARSAIEIGRAFLKQNKYDESVKIFDYLKGNVDKTNEAYYKVLANLGYSLIGREEYQKAIDNLLATEKITGKGEFRAWHTLAIAYSYFMMGDKDLYREWLEKTKRRPEYKRNRDFFKTLYSEISGDI